MVDTPGSGRLPLHLKKLSRNSPYLGGNFSFCLVQGFLDTSAGSHVPNEAHSSPPVPNFISRK